MVVQWIESTNGKRNPRNEGYSYGSLVPVVSDTPMLMIELCICTLPTIDERAYTRYCKH